MIKAHQKSIEELYEALDTNEKGLNNSEVELRLQKYGKNELAAKKGTSPVVLFLNQFRDLLVIILIVAGLITALIGILENDLGVIIEITAIVVVILLNAGLGFYQEYSAEKAIEALQSLAKSEVIVLRDGEKVKLKAEYLVPGDIVFLEAGNVVPSDIRVIKSYEISVSEAILTGESLPTRKINTILPEDTPLAERENMVHKGTTIVSGSGKGLVVRTGLDTEIGKIASSLTEIEREETPIQKKLNLLAKQLTIFILIIAASIFLVQIIIVGLEEFTELFIFAIGLAVAAVPEGLPAVMTLSLAIGVTRMARKNALIRKLPAVEVLGSSTVICTDKTGTLTKNEMTVKLIWRDLDQYEVTGTGYTNVGKIIEKSTAEETEPGQNLETLIEIATLANEASIEFQGEEKPYKTFGDPTEVALLILAEKAQGIEKIKQKWDIEYLFPFDSNRKRMSVVAKEQESRKYRIMVKGALDILLEHCISYVEDGQIKSLDPEMKEKIIITSERFSSNFAYRILGFAFRDIEKQEAERLLEERNVEKVENDLIFEGFVGMIDPPRSSSRPAVLKAREAGIRVIMITGDHKETARAVGNEISLSHETEPITGKQLEQITDEELRERVKTTEIFARVNPSHKLNIINAFKYHGEIVVMTGDGVNDAPALKRADIGVAMGITGTDVAKEASDMILVDDNFANIIEAVSEGRRIYDNIKKFISYLLSANAGEVITVLVLTLFGLLFFRHIFIPILAIQLLYINLVTDTFPALALGVSPPEKNLMQRKPRDPDEKLLDRKLVIFIMIFGLLNALGCTFLFLWTIGFNLSIDILTADLSRARTIIFAALVIYQTFQCLAVSQNVTIFSKKTLENKILIGAILLGLLLLLFAIYIPFMQLFIGTYPLPPIDWLVILITAIPILIFQELYEKFYLNR
ncbi:MAG: cation-translocating P-type ATPase [Promethearchaeati archaeon]